MTRPLPTPPMPALQALPAPHRTFAPRLHHGLSLLLLASLLSACGPRTAAPDPAAVTAGLPSAASPGAGSTASGAGAGSAASGAGAGSAASGAGAGTSGAGATASAPAGAAPAPPVSVTLVRAAARDFTVTLDASGTVTSLSSVDVKSQVSAQVLAVHVKEGQFVQRGQPLFTLDSRIDQANLKKAEAQLQKDEASRSEELV